MGEAKRCQFFVQAQALEAMVVDIPGGRIHVEQWHHGATATPDSGLFAMGVKWCSILVSIHRNVDGDFVADHWDVFRQTEI